MKNEAQIEHWSGPGGEHWASEHARYDRMLEAFGRRVREALGPHPAERIIDVGCGNGALARAIAREVEPNGEVVGVDIAAPMLARARELAAAEGLDNVSFIEADAAVHDFPGGSFDAFVSRFGVMFFDDPEAAFRNVVAALRPGGRAVFVCWRDLVLNEWLMVPTVAALEHVEMPAAAEQGGPGPFSLADPDRIRAVLSAAGMGDVELRELDEPTWMGSSGRDTLAFLQQTEMARTLFADVEPDVAARAWQAVSEALQRRAGPEGVVLTGSAWLVTARRPT